MKKKIQTLKNIATNKTWVSFLHDNHPYSLLHWSIAGVELEKKDVWLLQDEMTFEIQEFPMIDDALTYIEEHMTELSDIL